MSRGAVHDWQAYKFHNTFYLPLRIARIWVAMRKMLGNVASPRRLQTPQNTQNTQEPATQYNYNNEPLLYGQLRTHILAVHIYTLPPQTFREVKRPTGTDSDMIVWPHPSLIKASRTGAIHEKIR